VERSPDLLGVDLSRPRGVRAATSVATVAVSR